MRPLVIFLLTCSCALAQAPKGADRYLFEPWVLPDKSVVQLPMQEYFDLREKRCPVVYSYQRDACRDKLTHISQLAQKIRDETAGIKRLGKDQWKELRDATEQLESDVRLIGFHLQAFEKTKTWLPSPY